MSFLAKETRRRIAKLQRHAHAFHRYAHHPLCGAYASEVIRVGTKTRLCRGCTLAYGGLVLGVAAGLTLPVPAWTVALTLPLAMAIALTRKRLPKLATRAIPAFLLSTTVLRTLQELSSRTLQERSWWRPGMFQEPSWLVLGGLVVGGCVTLMLYRRRGPERSPCVGCPERGCDRVCSGFAPIDRAERAFVRLAHRLIDQRAA